MKTLILLLVSNLFVLLFISELHRVNEKSANALAPPPVRPDSTTLIFRASPSEEYEFFINTYYLESIPPTSFKNKKDSIIKFYFDKPVRLSLMDNLALPTTSYHINPGETVIFYKNSKKRTLPSVPSDSIRTNELAFFPAMNQALNSTFEGFDAYRPKLTSSSSELIRIANTIYKQQLAFLTTYQKQHLISKPFVEYMKAKFETMHYRNVLNSFSFGKRKADEAIRQFYVTNEFQPTDSTRVDERAFTYTRYTVNQEGGGQTNALIESANVVAERFSGLTRDYTLFQLITNAFRSDPQALPILIKQFNEIAQDSSLLARINARYKLLTTPEVDKQSNQSTLVSMNDETKTWTSLIAEKKDKLIYIDFWASWCGPCRAEMPNSKKLKMTYTGKNIDFVYISTDDNPAAWKQAMRQIGIQNAENYILPKGNKSVLAKELKINSIPRYILIKNGSILLPDAPRPGDPALQGILNKAL